MTLLALAAVACGDDEPPQNTLTCQLGFLGDPALPAEIQLVARGADGVSVAIEDGDEVGLIQPPQGGRVVFIGALATNIDACSVQLVGSMRDLTSNQVRVDSRTTNLLPRGDGWGGPIDQQIGTFANIPLCPNQWATTAVYDNPFELTITVTDRDERTASRTIQVVPQCVEPIFEEGCLCMCKEDYILGEACDGSGEGTGDGSGEGSGEMMP